MAVVTASNLTSGGQIATQSSWTTASITPTANNLVLVSVSSINNSVTPNQPTVSGCGLTWVAVTTATVQGGTQYSRLTLFRGMGSPTAGALTISFGGQNQVAASWSVNQFARVNTSGTNGSGAVIQAATNTNNGVQTGITATLGAFASNNNATYGVVYNDALITITKGGNFTQLSAASYDLDEWANNPQTSVNATWTSVSSNNAIIAIEIAAAASGFFQFL